MTESDLMLLEEYLDGELSAADARAVEERSVHEPELGKELARLKTDRGIRLQAWRSMEGDELAVESVAGKVAATIQRRESHTFLLRGLRIGAAAAACIVLGLSVGFFARQPASNQITAQAPVATKTADSDRIVFTGQVPSQMPSARGYDVRLKNDAGEVVAVQHFDNIEQARQFVQDVGTWQQRQEQMHSGNVSLVSDQY
ncbi:MAG TPA: zf-HC2 domain-containing protein [Tepidisphaeraceae bacterium]|jgi:anti-sigma factor RsiW